MESLKRYVAVFAVLCAFLVLCLPVSTFAINLYRVNVFGTVVGGSSGWSTLSSTQFTSNRFGYKPSGNPMNNCTYVSYFFKVDTDSIISFDINITDFYAYTGVENFGAVTCTINNTVITPQVSYKPIQGSDYVNLNWSYSGDSFIRGNIIRVTFRANTFSLSSDYWHIFEVNSFYVNGIDVDELLVTEYNAEWEDTISHLAQNEDRMWAQVVAPDLTDTLDRIQQANNETYSDYKSVISAVSVDNFLIPGLLMIVFSFAFYSYVVFGRKG